MKTFTLRNPLPRSGRAGSPRIRVLATSALLLTGLLLPTAPAATAVDHVPVTWPLIGKFVRLPSIPSPNWKPGHRGLDIKASYGQGVVAPVTGEVTWVGDIDGETSLTIEDGDGRLHTLLPITTELVEGDWVLIGAPIAAVDLGAHCRSKVCLHWGVREGGRYIDPRWLLPPTIFRLPKLA